MATIKSHTDLDQSLKLVEFLPLESADMKWYFWKSEIDAPKLPTFGYSKEAAENYKSTEAVYLPCWSLTALLNVLPNGTDVVKEKADTENERYMCTVLIKDSLITTFASNPVDACVDAIIKLNKRL